MLSIGEFSKQTGLSIRTLRYYNDIGLLIPEEVDLYTNYRYYGEINLETVKLINIYKNAGFSLEEIKENWNNFTEEILLKKKNELYKELDDVNNKIKQIDLLREHSSNKIKEKRL